MLSILLIVSSVSVIVTEASAITEDQRISKLESQIQKLEDRILVLESKKNGNNDARIDANIAKLQAQIDKKQGIIDTLRPPVPEISEDPVIQENSDIDDTERINELLHEIKILDEGHRFVKSMHEQLSRINADYVAALSSIEMIDTPVLNADSDRHAELVYEINQIYDRIEFLESRKNGDNDAVIDERILKLRDSIARKEAIKDGLSINAHYLTKYVDYDAFNMKAIKQNVWDLDATRHILLTNLTYAKFELYPLLEANPNFELTEEQQELIRMNAYVKINGTEFRVGDVMEVTGWFGPVSEDIIGKLDKYGINSQLRRVDYEVRIGDTGFTEFPFGKLCSTHRTNHFPYNPGSGIGIRPCIMNEDFTFNFTLQITDEHSRIQEKNGVFALEYLSDASGDYKSAMFVETHQHDIFVEAYYGDIFVGDRDANTVRIHSLHVLETGEEHINWDNVIYTEARSQPFRVLPAE